MHFISLAVIIYQIVIFSIIIASGAVSKAACIFTAIIACLWTLTHVFFPPLMILQFITVIVAFLIAIQLSSNNKRKNAANQINKGEITNFELTQRRKEIESMYSEKYLKGEMTSQLTTRELLQIKDKRVNKFI